MTLQLPSRFGVKRNRGAEHRLYELACLACAGMLWATTSAWCQTRDLKEDLGRLTIRRQTDHYSLSGTVSDERLAQFGRCLEYIYREYADGFTELLADHPQTKQAGPDVRAEDRHGKERPEDSATERSEPAPKDERFKVVIFATLAEYNEFGGAYFGEHVEHTTGLFVPARQLLIICDAGDKNKTYGVLFHEAFHQFVARYVPAMPTWLNEGLATYYGTARVTGKGLAFDRPASGYFRIVREGASVRQLIPLDELLHSSPAEFYSRKHVAGLSVPRRHLAYAEAYTLVVYLLSDSSGRKHLQRYIRELANAETDAQVRAVTARSFPPRLLETIVPEWLAKVNRGT